MGLPIFVVERDPLGGDIHIFFNRKRAQVKLLHFEGDGVGLYLPEVKPK